MDLNQTLALENLICQSWKNKSQVVFDVVVSAILDFYIHQDVFHQRRIEKKEKKRHISDRAGSIIHYEEHYAEHHSV